MHTSFEQDLFHLLSLLLRVERKQELNIPAAARGIFTAGTGWNGAWIANRSRRGQIDALLFSNLLVQPTNEILTRY